MTTYNVTTGVKRKLKNVVLIYIHIFPLFSWVLIIWNPHQWSRATCIRIGEDLPYLVHTSKKVYKQRKCWTRINLSDLCYFKNFQRKSRTAKLAVCKICASMPVISRLISFSCPYASSLRYVHVSYMYMYMYLLWYQKDMFLQVQKVLCLIDFESKQAYFTCRWCKFSVVICSSRWRMALRLI